MLSEAENELLCRVGPGTPMGDLLRRYWLPALLSQDLPEPDGRPLRLRLLGEDLVAYRDTAGRVGILAHNCPHRGASLFFGRNEEDGLRCVYHGWKFDVSGMCVDMPNEPAESNFKDKVHAVAYPAQERHGVIWAYLGRGVEPPLPELEWNTVPHGQSFLSARVQHCNWVQAMEGGIDPSHSAFLHSRLNEREDIERGLQRGGSRGVLYNRRNKHPHFETVDTAYGAAIAVRREAEDDSYYWRVNQFILPCHTMIPPYGADPVLSGFAWVPVDDETTWCLCWSYHPRRALSPAQAQGLSGINNDGVEALHPSAGVFPAPTTAPYGRYETILTRANDYRADWQAQKTVRFSGLPGLWPQDAGCQESMGPICDRTQEHLGASDSGVIQVRRRLINAARLLRETGVAPESAGRPQLFAVRAASAVLPRGQDWQNGIREQQRATPGVNYAAP